MVRVIRLALAVFALSALAFGLGMQPRQSQATNEVPYMAVFPADNQVFGYLWTLDADVTLTIDDPATVQSPDFTDTQTVGTSPFGPHTVVTFDLGAFQVEAGHNATMTDGDVVKEYTVEPLEITDVDMDTDTVSGTAAPGAEVEARIYGAPPPVTVIADGAGDWSATFPDIFPGAAGEANVFDDDGDRTSAAWNISNPHFTAFLHPNQVEGYDWPLDTEVTLTVDDPATMDSPDYTDAQMTEPFMFNPNTGFVRFDLGGFQLEPGFIVEMTDGDTTRTHTVLDLAVTQMNANTDIVSGTAPAGSEVTVSLFVETGPMKTVETGQAGAWTADFSGEYDINVGDQGTAEVADEQGLRTAVLFTVPEPPEFTSGDVNCDGKVDSLDALAILRSVAGLPYAGDCLPDAGDVNCDGQVNALDALAILRHVAGLPVVLPPGCPPIGQPA